MSGVVDIYFLRKKARNFFKLIIVIVYFTCYIQVY